MADRWDLLVSVNSETLWEANVTAYFPGLRVNGMVLYRLHECGSL